MIYPHPESLKRSRSGRVSTSTWPHVPLPRERVRASVLARPRDDDQLWAKADLAVSSGR